MPKKYDKKTSIGIEEDELDKINKVLMPNETLAKFGRLAILNQVIHREDEKIVLMTSTDQYHKMKNMEKDVDTLRLDIDILNEKLNVSKISNKRMKENIEFLLEHDRIRWAFGDYNQGQGKPRDVKYKTPT